MMKTEYKVIKDAMCLTCGHKAEKIEKHLNTLSAEGWEFVALDPVLLLGIDIGFYLIMKRQIS
ncbi:MAG: DUF4177 domain-containing protein [bacterium]